MTRVYKFDGSKALVEEEDEAFIARCKCGWSSEKKISREEAVIAFETHVSSDPKHRVLEEESGMNAFSLFLALLGLIYVLSPVDLVPDTVVGVGWIGDAIMLILSIMFFKAGFQGKPPEQVISNIFG